MSNENKSIHEFDFNLICEYFASVERQGPGSREVTLKALSFIDNLNEHSRIADLGCGTGWQTICWVSMFRERFWSGFVSRFYWYFESQCRVAPFAKSDKRHCRVNGRSAIWKRDVGLNLVGRGNLQYRFSAWTEWMAGIFEERWLRSCFGSFMVYRRPAEINDFWMDAYPEIDTIPNKAGQMQKAGYVLLLILFYRKTAG